MMYLLLTRWMMQIAHSMMYPDSGPDALALVLIGKQGIGKTTFFRHAITPPELREYYTEGSLHDKKMKESDRFMKLSGNLIWLDDEWRSITSADQEYIKTVLSMHKSRDRYVWGKSERGFMRRAIIGGTSNKEEALNDATDNRRILPFPVAEFKDDLYLGKDVDHLAMYGYLVNKIVQDKELCFRLQPGEQKWLSELTPLYRMATIASELQDHRFDWYGEPEEEEGKEWLTVSDILRILKRRDSQFQNDPDISMYSVCQELLYRVERGDVVHKRVRADSYLNEEKGYLIK